MCLLFRIIEEEEFNVLRLNPQAYKLDGTALSGRDIYSE